MLQRIAYKLPSVQGTSEVPVRMAVEIIQRYYQQQNLGDSI
jgi:hypothetical protein